MGGYKDAEMHIHRLNQNIVLAVEQGGSGVPAPELQSHLPYGKNNVLVQLVSVHLCIFIPTHFSS